MGHKRIEGLDCLEIRAPREDGYRTCAVCGGDPEPKPIITGSTA
jgi:hypothetical protein